MFMFHVGAGIVRWVSRRCACINSYHVWFSSLADSLEKVCGRHGVGRCEGFEGASVTTYPVSSQTPHPSLPSPHISPQARVAPNMDITGHFESASCVIEVDGSDTLAQVKGKLLAELGVSRARHVGVRMRGGGDIGNDDVRICDTVIDEGCAVELYCIGANITPGVIKLLERTSFIILSPCDRYLALMDCESGVSIFDTETHEQLCQFRAKATSSPAFSPCSEWISCVNKDTQCAEVHDVNTGALLHSFGDEGDERTTTAWSPCGTKLLSRCVKKGLQVWDIATDVAVHEWDRVKCKYVMEVTGDRVAMFKDDSEDVIIKDYTTGEEVLVLTCPASVNYVALSPNQRIIAACCDECVRVWNIETGKCVFEDLSENFTDVAVSDDIVAAHAPEILCLWSISTGKQLLHRDMVECSYGLAISSCGGVVICVGSGGVEIVAI